MGKGDYAYKEIFMGVSMPDVRDVAKQCIKENISKKEINKGVRSKIHEVRMCAFIVLSFMYKREKDESKKKLIYKEIIKNKKSIDNWDIVDIIIPSTVGDYILRNKKERKGIESYYKSKSIWERRIAILSCMPQIKQGDFKMFFRIMDKLIEDENDLIQKALGWLLREVWKKDKILVEKYILKNKRKMSRVTLRYAIEHMTKSKRLIMLKK